MRSLLIILVSLLFGCGGSYIDVASEEECKAIEGGTVIHEKGDVIKCLILPPKPQPCETSL